MSVGEPKPASDSDVSDPKLELYVIAARALAGSRVGDANGAGFSALDTLFESAEVDTCGIRLGAELEVKGSPAPLRSTTPCFVVFNADSAEFAPADALMAFAARQRAEEEGAAQIFCVYVCVACEKTKSRRGGVLARYVVCVACEKMV